MASILLKVHLDGVLHRWSSNEQVKAGHVRLLIGRTARTSSCREVTFEVRKSGRPDKPASCKDVFVPFPINRW